MALSAYAQEKNEFDLSGELRLKYFALSDEPDIFRNDYTEHQGENPDVEFGLLADVKLPYKLDVDLYPYAQYSQENKIARLGLKTNLRYDMWEDILKVGFTHHSWHNADVESPHSGGRSQDSVFADIYFAKLDRIELHLKPRFYFHGGEPLEIKTVYAGNEPGVSGELALCVSGDYGRFSGILEPYIQTSWGVNRYGVLGEVDYALNRNLSLFVESQYYTDGEENRKVVAVGMNVKFK